MLDKKIAQKIVDEVINSLGYNINVMNENAIIIGSGSPERIGTYHEIAMHVINNCNTCEVTDTESKKLQGVKSGINMPIVNKVGKVYRCILHIIIIFGNFIISSIKKSIFQL